MGAPGSVRLSGPLIATSRARPCTRIAGPRARSRSPAVVPPEPRFSIVQVGPDFSPRDYANTFTALQLPPSGKVLDLVPARLLCADVFERLAAAWTAAPTAVSRLGIVLSFERWVVLRGAALASLQPLAARGLRLEVFYAEQAAAGHLAEWFAHDRVVHDVRAAIATLAARWHPSPSWPMVINALARLVRAYTAADELPVLLTRIAALALSCGGAVEGATLAREALFYLPESASATRSQALRELGTALICQEQTVAGLAYLDEAFAVAAEAEAPDIGASALCHSGLCALNHGDYPGAERRFRRATELLSPPVRRPHLLALAHYNLAVALMHRRQLDAAEYHAQTALALRPDQESHLAEEDRILLVTLRALRGGGPAPQPGDVGAKLVSITTGSRLRRRVSEADV
jgi:tetratricopeptide (TPR) repeat protein